ncbi:hypothetical protein [Intestinibacter bartlettii]|uniref:hypothetical protein n=1 Tax=Intestinibacter bartlettii TaxID=261299 RepID=UPI0036F2BD9F
MRKSISSKNSKDIKVSSDLMEIFKSLTDDSFENDDDCLSTLLIIYKLQKAEEESLMRLKEYTELKRYLNHIEDLFNSINENDNKNKVNIEKLKNINGPKDRKIIKVNNNVFKMFKEVTDDSFENEDECLRKLIVLYELQQVEKNNYIKKENIKLQKYLNYIKYFFLTTIKEYNNEKDLKIEELKNEIEELNNSLKISKKKYSTLLKQKSQIEDEFVVKEKKYLDAMEYLKTEIILQGGNTIEFDFNSK